MSPWLSKVTGSKRGPQGYSPEVSPPITPRPTVSLVDPLCWVWVGFAHVVCGQLAGWLLADSPLGDSHPSSDGSGRDVCIPHTPDSRGRRHFVNILLLCVYLLPVCPVGHTSHVAKNQNQRGLQSYRVQVAVVSPRAGREGTPCSQTWAGVREAHAQSCGDPSARL